MYYSSWFISTIIAPTAERSIAILKRHSNASASEVYYLCASVFRNIIAQKTVCIANELCKRPVGTAPASLFYRKFARIQNLAVAAEGAENIN